MTRFLLTLATSLCILPLYAATQEKPKFKISPIGRLLIDAAAYLPNDSDFRPGVSMPDVRLGAKATLGDFSARIELGYSFGKFVPRDIYLQWDINDHSYLRAGYFIHYFGLQSATGASHKINMEEPMPQTVFGNPRLLGAMYHWRDRRWWTAVSLFAQNGSMLSPSSTLGRTGIGLLGRAIWSPYTAQGKILAIGLSPQWQSPTFAGKPENPFADFSANYPTKTANVQAIDAYVDSVRSVFKISPDITLAWKRFGLESQFFYTRAFRKGDRHDWNGLGVYVTGRVLLNRNASYSYNADAGCIAIPSPKSWEIVAGYSYTDASDHKAGVLGGKASNLNLTLNYYINSWLTWRLNYSWTEVTDRGPSHPNRHVNIFQTRIQAVF